MSRNVLRIDPGFVDHRRIEAILGEKAKTFFNQQIEKIPQALPDGLRQVQVDHIYSRVLVDFCKANGIPTLPQVLLEQQGRMFCASRGR